MDDIYFIYMISFAHFRNSSNWGYFCNFMWWIKWFNFLHVLIVNIFLWMIVPLEWYVTFVFVTAMMITWKLVGTLLARNVYHLCSTTLLAFLYNFINLTTLKLRFHHFCYWSEFKHPSHHLTLFSITSSTLLHLHFTLFFGYSLKSQFYPCCLF